MKEGKQFPDIMRQESQSLTGIKFNGLLTIKGNILTADISQIRQSFEPQFYQGVIQWIELTERWNMKESLTKQANITFKGAVRRNELTKEPCHLRITNLDRFYLLRDRTQ
jgi:hypothetical protein